MTQRIVYWFRNDLRLTDNEAFCAAAGSSNQVLPVFVFNPRQFSPTRLGFRRASARRAQFLIDTVASLRTQLREIGSDLLIRIGEPEKIVAELAGEFGADHVYASKEIAPEETRIESSLSKKLKINNIDIRLFWMDTLVHPAQLPFPISKLPSRFEIFREAIGQNWTLKNSFPKPGAVSTPAEFDFGTIPGLPALGIDPSELGANTIRSGGEHEALEALRHLKIGSNDPQIRTLTDSKLSVWLSLGCLSPKTIYHELSEVNSAAALSLLEDLKLRDYLHWVLLRFGPRLFKPSGAAHLFEKRWLNDASLFKSWIDGTTNQPEVNEAMKKLASSGYLTTAERDLCAKYLTDTLDVNWTWGAMYFESQLVDYDVSVIWGKWNNVAGVGEV